MEPTEKNDAQVTCFFNNINLKKRVLYIRNLMTIEPLICCVMVAKTVCVPALTNLNFEKACKVNAGFNDTVCTAILSGTYVEYNFTEQNNVVQHLLTNLRSWEVPVSSVVPVVLVLFVGSYSDRHKIRKPFLLMPMVGDMVALIGSITNVIYMREWSLEIQAVCDKVIPSVFGSDKLIILISYAYIADISTPEMRTLRMAVIPMMLSVCTPLAQAVSGVLFRAVGYIPIFSIGFLLYLIAFINGMYMVKEPIQNDKKETTKELIKDVFNVKHLVDTFTLLRRTEGKMRSNFLTVLLLIFITTMINTGEYSTFYLFAQTAYQWTVVDYSYYTTLGTVLNFIGFSLVLPLFNKFFQLHDLTIINISYFDAVVVSSIFVLCPSTIGLYIGRVVAVLKPSGRAAIRAQSTKYVSSEDNAKALSFNTVVSALAAIVSAQVYHQGIYEYTRETFPQAFFLLGIALHVLGMGLVMWMYLRNRATKSNEKEVDTINKEPIAPEAHVTYI